MKRRPYVQLDADLFLRADKLELDPVDLAIIGAIEARRNRGTGLSFASYATIAEGLHGVSARTVRRRIVRLRERGILVVRRRHDEHGHSQGFAYELVLPTGQVATDGQVATGGQVAICDRPSGHLRQAKWPPVATEREEEPEDKNQPPQPPTWGRRREHQSYKDDCANSGGAGSPTSGPRRDRP